MNGPVTADAPDHTGGAAAPAAHRYPLVGVLGGMGPAATADFYTKLVAATPATRDQDHLRVLIWSNPAIPDRSRALLDGGEDPTASLAAGIQALADAGARLLAVPCNTAHAFIPALAAQAGLELVSIVDATADHLAVVTGPQTCVGLLATRGTVASGLYHDACADRGVHVLHPDDDAQSAVDTAIAAVKAGRWASGDVDALLPVITGLRARGAEVVIAGCTELVLMLAGAHPGVPVIDPAVLLARAVVHRATDTTRPRHTAVS